MNVISAGVLVLGLIFFLLSSYHFVRLQSFIRKEKSTIVKNMVPFLLLSSSTYTNEGQTHYSKFLKFLSCAALATGLVLIFSSL